MIQTYMKYIKGLSTRTATLHTVFTPNDCDMQFVCEYKYGHTHAHVHSNMSARTQHRLRPFWIHLQYGRSKSERVLEFNPLGFSTVNDVLKRMKYAHSDLYLCNKHGERLEYEHILEKARTYILKRQPISR